MRVFWWNGGLHIEPETDDERDDLTAMARAFSRLHLVEAGHQVHPGPISAVAIHDEQSVGGVHVLPQVITERR